MEMVFQVSHWVLKGIGSRYNSRRTGIACWNLLAPVSKRTAAFWAMTKPFFSTKLTQLAKLNLVIGGTAASGYPKAVLDTPVVPQDCMCVPLEGMTLLPSAELNPANSTPLLLGLNFRWLVLSLPSLATLPSLNIQHGNVQTHCELVQFGAIKGWSEGSGLQTLSSACSRIQFSIIFLSSDSLPSLGPVYPCKFPGLPEWLL